MNDDDGHHNSRSQPTDMQLSIEREREQKLPETLIEL